MQGICGVLASAKHPRPEKTGRASGTVGASSAGAAGPACQPQALGGLEPKDGGPRSACAPGRAPSPQATGTAAKDQGWEAGSAGVGPHCWRLQSPRPRRPDSRRGTQSEGLVSAQLAGGALPPGAARPTSASPERQSRPCPAPPRLPLTFRHDLLRRGWRRHGPHGGRAEGCRECVGRGAERGAAVRVPRAEAFPPGGRAAESFFFPLHGGGGGERARRGPGLGRYSRPPSLPGRAGSACSRGTFPFRNKRARSRPISGPQPFPVEND